MPKSTPQQRRWVQCTHELQHSGRSNQHGRLNAPQILDNLLDNAEKYSRTAQDRRVAVTISAEACHLRVRVSDGGPGVHRRARNLLFRPFERPPNPDAPSGLGLGLALARSLARAQGGDLRLLDTSEPGATFELTVPMAGVSKA